MKIAQVAPLHESVPPKLYGGTERVVSYLTEALLDGGHDVTLFASGDSKTRARLVSPCPSALRLKPDCIDPWVYHVVMLEEVYRRASEFDVIHFHIDYQHFPRTRARRLTHVTTLHGRLDQPDLSVLYREFPRMPVVSISDAQREPLAHLNWLGTVHHGLPISLLTFNSNGGDCLVFLGRISPEKGPDRAIEIAVGAGLPLKIAAKVDKADECYFREIIFPLIAKSPGVQFIGEVDEKEKNNLLGNALALLFPINWPEPFGLVMIEAMACGTPVIAFPAGAVPEVIDHGVTGFLCRNVDEAIRYVKEVGEIPRWRIRGKFESRFSAERMAKEYESIYLSAIRASDDVRSLSRTPPPASDAPPLGTAVGT